jgi:hypothetical protein
MGGPHSPIQRRALFCSQPWVGLVNSLPYVSYTDELPCCSAPISVNVHLTRAKATLKLDNIKSYDFLVGAVQTKWKDLLLFAFALIRHESSEDHEVASDEQLRAFAAGKSTVSLEVIVDARGFSAFKHDIGAAMTYLNTPFTDPNLIAEVEFPRTTELDDAMVDAEVETILHELGRRRQCIDLQQATEYSMREFISVILIGAACLCPGVTIVCEREIVGRHAHGPVDWCFLSECIDIVLTEAKKTNMLEGLVQNLLQQGAAVDFYANNFVNERVVGEERKKKFDEVRSEIVSLPTYGIVSTGREWRFTRCLWSVSGNTMVAASKVFLLDLDCSATTRNQVKELLLTVVSICQEQKRNVAACEPLRKRRKSLPPQQIAQFELYTVGVVEEVQRQLEEGEGGDAAVST